MGIGNWELGIGNWELGIGNWQQLTLILNNISENNQFQYTKPSNLNTVPKFPAPLFLES
ncbi:MAG: hypothetical protein F6K47_09400 [Symploca sp. SIO2E6]|nr:hypothetical protein [Symploca sp. SIO2E6]